MSLISHFRLVAAYKKVHKFSAVISYFSTQQWRFYNNNVKELSKTLTPGDRALFDFDISNLNWEEFFYTYVRGIRLYLIKDTFETIEEGKRKQAWLKVAHYSIVSVFSFFLFQFAWAITRWVGLFS